VEELQGVWKKAIPARVNELVGVQHTKIFIFDDTLIITG
jgi:CDP-diacylglycerol--glycerol-3-phosphate 3-phosphatidyltransferase